MPAGFFLPDAGVVVPARRTGKQKGHSSFAEAAFFAASAGFPRQLTG
jgi:hypothetical protein